MRLFPRREPFARAFAFGAAPPGNGFRCPGYAHRLMETRTAPSLLPILRSRQQGQILALLLCNPDDEHTLSGIAHLSGAPLSSVHREVGRAEKAGLLVSRRAGSTRLVRADTANPYHPAMADLLLKAFGPPAVLADALAGVAGIHAAYIYGSWAARLHGVTGPRPVNDIDVLILGEPDRREVASGCLQATELLGRTVNTTIRPQDWLETGTSSFHATVTGRPLVPLPFLKSQVDTARGSRDA